MMITAVVIVLRLINYVNVFSHKLLTNNQMVQQPLSDWSRRQLAVQFFVWR